MNMHKAFLFLVTIAIALMALACGGEKASQNSDDSAAFDSAKVAKYSGYTAVAVTHSVKSYDEWLQAYDTISDPDSRLSIYASPDDPNLVTIFELTKSHAEAKNAFGSDAQKKSMQQAGVNSPPIFHYYDIKYKVAGKTDKTYRLGVTHKVVDYDKWKKEFDLDEPIRAEAGLELRAISTDADDPTIVNVLFATNDIAKAKDLIQSDKLKKRMAAGGVISEPELIVLKIPNQ